MNDKIIKPLSYLSVTFLIGVMSVLVIISKIQTSNSYAAEKQIEQIQYSNQKRYDRMKNTLAIIPKSNRIGIEDIEIREDVSNNTMTFELPGDYVYLFRKINAEYIKGIEATVENGNTVVDIAFNSIYCCELKEDNDSIYFKVAKPKDVYDYVFVIDPGHGGYDPGKEDGTLQEKDLVLNVGLTLREKLKDFEKENSVKIYYTRIEDVYPTLKQRAKLANQVEADLFISIHMNAYVYSSKVRGVETFYKNHNVVAMNFANAVQKSISKTMNTRSRGVLAGNDTVFILRHAKVPAILIELGFLTNSAEAGKLSSTKYHTRIADDIIKSLNDFVFGG